MKINFCFCETCFFAEFERNVYQAVLSENSPPGTTVVQVKAVDKDSGMYGTEGIRYTGLTGSIANEYVNNDLFLVCMQNIL